MIREFVLFLLAYWEVLQVVLIVTAIVILVSSAEDLLLDLMYWIVALFGRRHQPRFGRLKNKPQRPVAILVPAWQEHEVIARMLANTVGTSRYQNFHIFVGVYANDERTRKEVDYVCGLVNNVHRVDVGHDGPTNKADCLNGIIRGIRDFERRNGVAFALFVNHDAEDVVHPYALHVMNYFIDGNGMVQLPVRSLDRGVLRFVACHYMDEFAEWHGKDLVARSALTNMCPSAGVGTAISREAMEGLVKDSDDGPFNSSSLTEDYDVAHRLRQLGFSSRFVRYVAPHPAVQESWIGYLTSRVRSEVVDTREYFPHRLPAAVRQKARWMLGISYFGWRQLGWKGDLANRYFLMRDRKALITAPAAMIGYLLVFHWLINSAVIFAFPWLDLLPPLVEQDWVWDLIYVNFGLMANRLFHRALFVGRAHGLKHVWLSPLRAVVGNYIAFRAFMRATRLFVWHVITDRPVAWDKTQHRFPTGNRLTHSRRQLGDVVTHWGMVTPRELRKSLRAQGTSRRPLGLQLLDDKAIDDDSLAQAFGELFGTTSGTFDPLLVPDAVRDLLPRETAARLSAFVVERPEPERVLVVLAEPLTEKQQQDMIRTLAAQGVRDVTYKFAPLSDVAFGIRFAYDSTTLRTERGIVTDLRLQGHLTQQQETVLWRRIRRGYVRLGDLLVRRRLASPRTILNALAADHGPMGERLRKMGILTGRQLSAAVSLQMNPPIDVLGIAARAGIISPRLRDARAKGALRNGTAGVASAA